MQRRWNYSNQRMMYSMQLKIGKDYELDFIKDLEKVHTKWQIREEEYFEKLLTEDLEIHIISLPKARKKENKDENDKLLQWLAFLDNPNNKGVLEMKKKNQDIADALWKLEEISEDKKLRRIAQLKERWEKDEISAQRYWKENGLAEGRKEGKEEGRKEGKREEQIKIAKKMKEKGMDIDSILEITGLTKEEFEKIS